jgi:hypothetical protein
MHCVVSDLFCLFLLLFYMLQFGPTLTGTLSIGIYAPPRSEYHQGALGKCCAVL